MQKYAGAGSSVINLCLWYDTKMFWCISQIKLIAIIWFPFIFFMPSVQPIALDTARDYWWCVIVLKGFPPTAEIKYRGHLKGNSKCPWNRSDNLTAVDVLGQMGTLQMEWERHLTCLEIGWNESECRMRTGQGQRSCDLMEERGVNSSRKCLTVSLLTFLGNSSPKGRMGVGYL